jgi:hypothetical protein
MEDMMSTMAMEDTAVIKMRTIQGHLEGAITMNPARIVAECAVEAEVGAGTGMITGGAAGMATWIKVATDIAMLKVTGSVLAKAVVAMAAVVIAVEPVQTPEVIVPFYFTASVRILAVELHARRTPRLN